MYFAFFPESPSREGKNGEHHFSSLKWSFGSVHPLCEAEWDLGTVLAPVIFPWIHVEVMLMDAAYYFIRQYILSVFTFYAILLKQFELVILIRLH